jgi:hypothetical protein
MSVDVTQIEAIRDAAATQIENLLATSGPTITVNGAEVVWAPLLSPLRSTLDWCDQKLAEYQPYEVRSRGKT